MNQSQRDSTAQPTSHLYKFVWLFSLFHQSWKSPHLTMIYLPWKRILPGNYSVIRYMGIFCELHRLLQRDASVKDLLPQWDFEFSKKSSGVRDPNAAVSGSPSGSCTCFPPPLGVLSPESTSASSRRYFDSLLSDIQLKCTKKSAVHKE